MQKVYREEMILRTCNCDFQGTWRPSAIFEAMQEVSGMHSHLLGCGRSDLMKQGLVWVLSRIEVQMLRYPGVGDKIYIETFPMANRRWFFPRYFIFRDVSGEELGYASSLWVLLDVKERKMAAPGTIVSMLPDNTDLTAPMGMPETAWEAEAEETVHSRTPLYTDLDVNGHVNNTKYIDWLCDALGIDCMQDFCFQSICVNYNTEVLPGQEIAMHLRHHEGKVSLVGIYGEKRHFEICGTLIPRNTNVDKK